MNFYRTETLTIYEKKKHLFFNEHNDAVKITLFGELLSNLLKNQNCSNFPTV